MTAVAAAPLPVDVLTDPAATVDAWVRWLRRTGLADQTKAKYEQQVRAFAAWLGGQDNHQPGEVFLDPNARDYAVRDYRRWLLTDGGSHPRAPKGVDLALTSLANLYEWVGLGRPKVPSAAGRQRSAPQALTEDTARAVLRAAERRGPRDRALTTLFLASGLRISELAALNVDDVWATERKGEVQVRAGKGDRPRKVPLNQQARDAVRTWLHERAAIVRQGPDVEQGLFITRTGVRMAIRTVRHTIAEIGKAAGVDLHPHMLRHTFATRLARADVDMVTLAELLGHARLDTVRIYTRPTAEVSAAAVEHAAVDF